MSSESESDPNQMMITKSVFQLDSSIRFVRPDRLSLEISLHEGNVIESEVSKLLRKRERKYDIQTEKKGREKEKKAREKGKERGEIER